jgi:hypothetical protein
MYVTGTSALRDAQREQWPYGLGTLKDLEGRAGKGAASSAAKEITRLADALEAEEASPADYVSAQTSKTNDQIDAPPPTAGLKGHEAPLAEIVHTVVGAGNRLVWGAGGTPWQLDDAGQMIAAAALDRARNGDGAGAWENVHALWILARSVDAEPYGADTALKLSRAANAVARKLPPPAPPWAGELAAFNPRRETAAIIQQNTESRVSSNSPLPGPLILFKPMADWIEASNARRSRAAAEAMSKAPRCRIDTSQDLPHTEEAYRAARMEAELEATAKILALKNERARLGRWPAALDGAGASRCAENRWIYEPGPSGRSMKLHMSWEVAAEPANKTAPALAFAY